MKDAYTKLMVQQYTSPEGDAVFFEKLEKAGKKPRPVWKAAVVAACILLLVPVTVWAAESIFGVARITIKEGKDFFGRDSIVFHRDIENVEHIPITKFSGYLQNLKETEWPLFASWEEAEEEIGIDFISNSVLQDEGTQPHAGKNPKEKPFTGTYYVYDEQLFAVKFHASYFRNRIGFMINTFMTTDHPLMTEELFLVYHGFGDHYYSPKNTEGISVEQFITKNGIPVTIYYPVHDDFDWILPHAYFSVNNVSYHIDIIEPNRLHDDETITQTNERVYALLIEILEGFTVE